MGKAQGIVVRLARDDEDVDPINAGNVLWQGQAKLRNLFAAGPPEIPTALLVGELDGAAVGCATAIGDKATAFGYGLGMVYVQPHARRRGLGRALMMAVVDVVRRGSPPGVMFSVPDSDPAGLSAAARLGLVLHGHHIESRLDLEDLSADRLKLATARAAATGIDLATLADDASDDAWLEAFTFLSARLKEAPDSREGGGGMPYPIFRTIVGEPWRVLLARRDGQLVGVTSLMERTDAPGRLNTLFTGVHPDARGAGIAAAMKAEHARLCADRGWSEIRTQNMDQNAPILAVNARLGFVAVTGTSDVGLAFDDAPSS